VPGPALKRSVKQRLLTAPSALRDSAAVRAGFRAREAASAAVGDLRYRNFRAPDGLPVPPARLRVAVSGIADPSDHLDAGRRSAHAIDFLLERNGLAVGNAASLLDFGCGSGRVARQWAELPKTAIHGCDYNADAIAWCQANMPFASWAVNQLAPPLPYGDESFGLAYGLSVFTHFTSDLQGRWMAELRRVIAPGGHLIFTTMGGSFRSHLSPQEQEDFDAGRLTVHFPNSAGSNMCAAYHPRAYVDELIAGAGLALLDALPADEESPYPQDMWLVSKPA
jgi:SAM-dependent methyltransferase